LLRRVFRRHQFDLVHVQELQHSGYSALAAFKKVSPGLLFVSNWGSDIYWFRQFRNHRRRIASLLRIATHYSAECHRDVKMAVELGFEGTFLPIIPNAGGLAVEEILKPAIPPSRRKLVLVKGYTGFVGQALVALRVIRDARNVLDDYEVVIYSASHKARLYGAFLRSRYRLKIRLLRPGVDHADILNLFRAARVYLGVSLSDGISTSLLEAMATGCFPIQTNTSCGNEWITDDSGVLLSPDDHAGLVAAVRMALTNDDHVEAAAIKNRAIAIDRATAEKISGVARAAYHQIVSKP
jgi:glycosyltransferase involved in cell wall biosynthesis